MISKFKQIEELFKEIDKVMHKKVNIYTIGGTVLLEQGLKAATKDIDIVVAAKEELIELQRALGQFGFSLKIPGKGYKHMNLNQIFQKGNHRIDLFEREVCGRFSLSEGMRQRARKMIGLKYITLFLCSNEDVFLFKTMTERDGDLEDCESLVVPGVDWKIILQELKNQIKESKQDVWITWIGERFDLLEERGLEMPIMNEVNKMRNKYLNDCEKKHKIK